MAPEVAHNANQEARHFERKERRSANPRSSVRAPPKKEGGGGRFTFGRLGMEAGPACLDAGDPNFDSEAEQEQDLKKKSITQQVMNTWSPDGRATSFEDMERCLCSGSVESETNSYIWAILQSENSPRVAGIYSSHQKARERLAAMVAVENERRQAGWMEGPPDTWSRECDVVYIAKFPLDPCV